MYKLSKSILILCLLSLSITTFAQQKPTQLTPEYEGTVLVGRGCSGSIVQFDGQSDNSMAYVMTNAHCFATGMGPKFPTGAYWENNNKHRVSLDVVKSDGTFLSVGSREVHFATMTYTDVAFLRIRTSYSTLKAKGVTKWFQIGRRAAEKESKIQIISSRRNRIYQCKVRYIVPQLYEGKWVFTQALRYAGPEREEGEQSVCNIVKGTSGSPVILAGTNTIVGINSTGNEYGEICTLNNPCEVLPSGKKVDKGASYGLNVNMIYDCLTDDFDIDSQQPGCLFNELKFKS